MLEAVHRFLPYIRLMRLDRPIGIYLLLWPTLIALWLAGEGKPDGRLILIFTLGVIVMRSAGCIINDFADRRIDGLVERTKLRPLVTGELTVKQAWVLFGILIVMAFGLVLLTNTLTVCLSFIALLIAMFYPFAKRWTHFPQVVLGMAFSMGIPMAFAAQTGELPLTCWLLFGASTAWALAYDTLYAMADKEEDIQAHIQSIAVWAGKYDKLCVAMAHGVTFCLMGLAAFIQQLSSVFYLFLFASILLALYEQWAIRKREKAACFGAFLNNHWIGMLLFIGVVLGR